MKVSVTTAPYQYPYQITVEPGDTVAAFPTPADVAFWVADGAYWQDVPRHYGHVFVATPGTYYCTSMVNINPSCQVYIREYTTRQTHPFVKEGFTAWVVMHSR